MMDGGWWKQAVIKHRAKIHTEPLYFALNSGREKY